MVEKLLVARRFVWNCDKNWLLCLLLIKGLFSCPLVDVVVEILCELKRKEHTLGVLESLYQRLKAARVEIYSRNTPFCTVRHCSPRPHVLLANWNAACVSEKLKLHLISFKSFHVATSNICNFRRKLIMKSSVKVFVLYSCYFSLCLNLLGKINISFSMMCFKMHGLL